MKTCNFEVVIIMLKLDLKKQTKTPTFSFSRQEMCRLPLLKIVKVTYHFTHQVLYM